MGIAMRNTLLDQYVSVSIYVDASLYKDRKKDVHRCSPLNFGTWNSWW